MFGKITRSTFISGDHVAAGTVVEVDESTYRQLRACGKIEPHKAAAGDGEKVKPAAPKFKKVAAPDKSE
jgi:hypothetical protein